MRTIVGELPVEAGSVRLAPPDATIGWLPQTAAGPGGVAARLRPAPYRRGRRRPRPRGRLRGAGRPARPAPTTAYAAALERWLALGARRPRRPAAAGRRPARPRRRPGPAARARLSGGQAARAALASVLLSRYDVLLLDEPTNNLDARGLALMATSSPATRARCWSPATTAPSSTGSPPASSSSTWPSSGSATTPAAGRSTSRPATSRGGRPARRSRSTPATRDRLVAQARQRADWAAKGRRNVATRRRARQAHPGEVQGPRRPAGRQGGAASGRPSDRLDAVDAAAQGVGAALLDRRRARRPPTSCGRSTGSR